MSKETKTECQCGREAPSGKAFHILIAEDEPTLRYLWGVIIETWGLPIRISSAEDGYSAIVRISDDPPDLIITDIEMPGIDGRGLINIVSKSQTLANVPIIIASGSKTDDLLARPSVIRCFSKPVPFEEIRKIVEQLIHRQTDAQYSCS